ncbi:microcystin dependent MdpB family protein [Undibacterium sp. YM2]|uniref:phage tail protein n=1 Tax=Undibacterium sp. YM2 TaxID=2058625 RepID=UPI001331ED54|nr:tail fiber protein [Undibacterium sp. YM2]BBB69113.1 microcystin dependent MdpB family protein [Undibacterium sp. YM2]
MDAFMGTVLAVGFNYPPRGWLFCNGQTVPISQNSAMFALLGTMYGGDGQNTFGIPDLRGRVVVGSQAQGPGLQNVVQGERAGSNNATVISNGTATISLTTANMPSHTHTGTVTLDSITASTTINVGTGTNGGVAAVLNNGGLTSTASGAGSAAAIYLPAGTAPTSPVALGGVTTSVSGSGTVNNSNTGGGTPLTVPVVSSATISNMQPYLGLNYIIAMEGIFPSRN